MSYYLGLKNFIFWFSEPKPIFSWASRKRKKMQYDSSINEKRIAKRIPATWKTGDIIVGQFDEFEVKGTLGEGGMGTVYKIHLRKANIDLAMKSPRPEIFGSTGGKENFIREAETWVKLKAHPHIVKCPIVLSMNTVPRSVPLVFAEYVDGGSLADWIRQRRLYEGGHQRSLERILDVAIQTAWGLHAAHEQGLVHQDVKPANILLTNKGVAKVTDFGLAKARAMAGEENTQQGTRHQGHLVSFRGMTRAYCSPEQWANQALSHKTDIWSWGVCMLEMFIGEVTWEIGAVAAEVLEDYQQQEPIIPMMPAEVVSLLRQCFQRHPDDRPSTMEEVAMELQVIHVRLLGRLYLRSTPKSTEEGVDGLSAQGYSLLVLGRYEKALEVYERVIQLAPTDANAYHRKGIALNRLGRNKEALEVYEQAIRLDPTYAEVYYNKGIALGDLGRNKEALLAYEQAIRLDPTHAEAYYHKGVALSRLGRNEEALVIYEQATRLDPKNADAHYNKGIILGKIGRYEEALLAYEQVIRLAPTDARAYMEKGNMLSKLGRNEEALVIYEQAIRLDPKNAHIPYNKGVALGRLGRYEEALLAYEYAIQLAPSRADAHYNKGITLGNLGRYEEALLAYEQVIRLDPSRAEAIYNKGVIFGNLGRYEEALAACEQVIRLDPTLVIASHFKNHILQIISQQTSRNNRKKRKFL
jgi:tetratricopeptide (TPR) repeat protein